MGSKAKHIYAIIDLEFLEERLASALEDDDVEALSGEGFKRAVAVVNKLQAHLGKLKPAESFAPEQKGKDSA